MPPETRKRVASVRAFNRFYTNVIGVLHSGLLDTPYSLTEARILFELAQRDTTEVAELRRVLDIDAGYLSRILSRFEADGLAVRERSAEDARRQLIRLTGQGQTAFSALDARQDEDVAGLLATMSDEHQRRLLGAMSGIRELLGDTRSEGYVLRPPGPGDLGWVVNRHGVLYAEEYDWDATFEALVARVVSDYASDHDPAREAGWIAEADGEPAGCVFCVRGDDDATAKLRLLLVEPSARGRGIGAGLVAECMRFARQAGYRRMTLWTNDVLDSARRIYQGAGFELVDEEKHHSFGHDLVGQNWARAL